MTKFQQLMIAGIVAGGALAPAMAQAAVSYSYQASFDSGTTFPTTDTVAAGSSVTVSVYLHEALTNSSASVVAGDGGMYSGAFLTTRTAGTATINTASFAKNSSFGGNSGTDGANSSTHLSEAENIGTSFNGIALDGNGNLLLGTYTITAGAAGTTSTFNLGRYNSGGGNTLTNNDAYDLDFNSTSPAFTGATTPESFSIVVPSAVPEPASLALLALGGVGVLARRRRNA